MPFNTLAEDGMIYGMGGYNRYSVNPDGEIVFLAQYCEFPDGDRIAKNAGFKTMPKTTLADMIARYNQ